jgi:hypothetical protein
LTITYISKSFFFLFSLRECFFFFFSDLKSSYLFIFLLIIVYFIFFELKYSSCLFISFHYFQVEIFYSALLNEDYFFILIQVYSIVFKTNLQLYFLAILILLPIYVFFDDENKQISMFTTKLIEEN